MKRRTLVVLVSAVTLLTAAFVVVATVGVGIGTDAGREVIRKLIEQEVAGRVKGTVHIGRIRGEGAFLTGFTMDTFAIRGPDDSLLVSVGRVSVEYNPRDLMDRRLLLRNVRVDHPVVRLRQHEDDWNFQRIFRSGRSSKPDVPGGRSLGDFVVLDSVHVRNGEFILTRPWEPDDTLSGAKRDSAIRRNLTNPEREIRRSAEGYTQTHRWSKATGFLPRVRLAHPDSNRFGQLFVIDSLRVEEQEPPFSFRNARGAVRKQGDSVFVDIAHFDLPASTGRAQGKIWWGSDLPIRVDVRVQADSVSLKDVAWVYETLPREGGGKTNLHIRNNAENLRIFEYALSDMDVRSTKSRLTGAMTFVVGGPVLAVTEVDLRAAPVNFDLLRTLAGGPFPTDWQGDLTGHAKGPGGPLTNFVVSESEMTWRDTNVRGAISRFSGRGELDILDPAVTAFHGFDVTVQSLDLRSIEHLFPGMPRLGGKIAGVATLDSTWLDVRFSDANVTHINGPGEPTRATGSGRVTYGEEFLTYDVSMNAEPLSLTMFSRAYPLGLKGVMSGPIRAKGTADDLELTMDLQGPAGKFSYSGRVDAYPSSVAAHGSGRVEGLDLSALVAKAKVRPGWVTGTYELAVRGDTSDLAKLNGAAIIAVDRAEVDGIRVFPSRLRARFAEGRMFVDTLRVESVAANAVASGAIGLGRQYPDSISYSITVDSLGGLRRYITELTSAFPAQPGVADSMSGTITLRGVVSGSLDALDVSGRVLGNDVFVRKEAGREIVGSFALSNVLQAPAGSASLRVNRLNVGRVTLDTLGATLQLSRERAGSFTFGALSMNGVTLAASGDLAMGGSRTNVSVRALSVVTDSSRWALAGRSNIETRGADISIDSLVLVNGRGGRVALGGAVTDTGEARFTFTADSVPLRDVGIVAQLPKLTSGWGRAYASGAGTGMSPVITVQSTMTNVKYGDFRPERVTARAEYANRRSQVTLDVMALGKTAFVATGSLPLELKYFGARLLDDPLSATIRSDSASFDIIEALVPSLLSGATGRLIANLDVAGTWTHPDITGGLRVENGEVTVGALGVRLKGVQVDLALFGHADSLAIRRMVAWSGTTPADSVSLLGYIAYRDLANPLLALRAHARNFRALDKRGLARLDLSTESPGIELGGPFRGATLRGGVVIDRGTYFLPDPELARKQTVDFAQFTDVEQDAAAAPTSKLLSSFLLDGLRITLGDDVWLRSREANIKLGGSLNVQRSIDPRRVGAVAIGGRETRDSILPPALEGTLRAERGTYTLNLLQGFQREFQVEGGTITFFGSSELQPVVDISALHVVRRAKQSNLRIKVRLSGPLYPNSNISLESGESYAMSQSEIVSYLVFGVPSFALGEQDTRTAQRVVQTLIPTGHAALTNQLREWIPFSDYLQLNPGDIDTDQLFGSNGGGYTQAFQQFLGTTRVGTEFQVSDNVFASLTAGLCQLDPTYEPQERFLTDVANGMAAKIEYRFSSSTSLKAGREPPANALSCGRHVSGRAFVPTPPQWGLSLFQSWRF